MKGTDRHPHGRFSMPALLRCGRRKGAEDSRYLWPHMLRAIHEIRPGWIVGENVGGILQVVQPGKAAHVGCQPSLFGEDQLYTVSGRNTSSRPSAVILSVKDIPSSRCLFRLVPSVPRTEGTVSGLLPTPIASDFKVRGPGSQQKGLPEIIREMLLPTPTATEIRHRQRWNVGNVRGAPPCTRRKTGRRIPTA